MPEKIIRDPVHDVIAFRMERPTDALLFRLIATREVQRLRRIRQLGMAHLAYPGADHSRYSHSLGVMETARKILLQLGASFQIDPDRQTVCLVAALLHDLGHGPYSHVFERVTGIDHEQITRQLILDNHTEVHALLAEHDAALPGRVADMISCAPRRDFFCDILSSQLDADRMDYLLRDNLMTGSRYGGYDLRWLLHALTLAKEPTADAAQPLRLVVTAKGVSAVEAYLQCRYHMYRNVYFHKVVRGGEGMLRLILQRARALTEQSPLAAPPADPLITKALSGKPLAAEEFVELDDVSLTACFKLWARGPDPILARLCQGILYRRLFKTIDLSRIDDPERLAGARTAAAAAITRAGGDPAYEMLYDEPADVPYERPSGAASVNGGAGAAPPDHDLAAEILIQQPGGTLVPFGAVSPMSRSLNRQLTFRRIHVAEQWRAIAHRAVEDAIGRG